jgi:hypothetical protein
MDAQPAEAHPPLPPGEPDDGASAQFAPATTDTQDAVESEHHNSLDPSAPPPLPAEEKIEEEDPLVVAQRQQEEREQALHEAANIHQEDDAGLKVRSATLVALFNDSPCCRLLDPHRRCVTPLQAFYNEMRDVDRENEVNRILGAFKLNPYEQLGLRFTATDEEVRRAYRKVSLMVHPDKCPHPRATDAFEIIGGAQKELLDENKRMHLDYLLSHARDEVRKEVKKASKHDAAVRVAALLNEGGKEGVMAAYEETDEFHEAWKMKARDVLARAEWRKRKMTKRVSA